MVSLEFFIDIILPAALWHWASNRNVYREYFLGVRGGRCVQLTTLPPSCADCLEIWEPQPPGTLSGPVQACNGIALPYLIINLHRFHCKVPINLVTAQSNLNFVARFSAGKKLIKFRKNPSNGRRVVPCGRTDRQTGITALIFAFNRFPNAHKNGHL